MTLVGGELGAEEAVARAERRLERYCAETAAKTLAPLAGLRNRVDGARELDGLARGVAFRLVENFGAAPRRRLAQDLDQLSKAERRQLRSAGVRIGEHAVFLPALLKPKAARLNALLKAVSEGRAEHALDAPPGRTSLAIEAGRSESDYAAAGYQRCGPLAVRLDILERLADLIRAGRAAGEGGGFALTAEMTALLGCTTEELRGVLKTLGYRRTALAGDDAPETWKARRKPDRRRKPETSAAPRADTPFAKLAELDIGPGRKKGGRR